MAVTFQTFLFLLAVLAAVAVVARKVKIAPAILWLVTGMALAFIPGVPTITLAPELVLLVILPPLIYSAGVAMSWREFRKNLRPISFLAIGCVIFTAALVAVATHYVIGLPWSVGFLLGAIVAPPDVVAPLAIARRLRLPRRMLVILEGEGLANDATALILYRFAVAAIATGMFSFPKAAGTFAAIVVCELMFGIAVGWLSLRLRKWARDPRIEITLSLLTPYLAFWVPEHFGGSGVLATVAAGLYISWNGPLLISSSTRLQGIFFWDLAIYLNEGVLFLLTGFQMRSLVEKSKAFPLTEILAAIGLVSVVIIVARFAWVFPATVVPRLISKRRAAQDPLPSWRPIFILAFTGVRGAVSLAAALALPFTLPNGDAFPYRDMILFVAFGVILVTMIGLGLTLPVVVRALGVTKFGPLEQKEEHAAEVAARRSALEASLRSLEDIHAKNPLAEVTIAQLRMRHETRSQQLPDLDDPNGFAVLAESGRLQRELISAERKFLHQLLRDGQITDESRRRIERDLDLEEAAIANREHAATPL